MCPSLLDGIMLGVDRKNVSLAGEEEAPMSSEEEFNKALVRRFLEAHAKGDLNTMEEMLAPDFVDHNLLYGIRLYTSRHEGETKFGAIGVPSVRESLPEGNRSGIAHPFAYGLAGVARGFARRGGRDGGLLQEVDHRDPQAL